MAWAIWIIAFCAMIMSALFEWLKLGIISAMVWLAMSFLIGIAYRRKE